MSDNLPHKTANVITFARSNLSWCVLVYVVPVRLNVLLIHAACTEDGNVFCFLKKWLEMSPVKYWSDLNMLTSFHMHPINSSHGAHHITRFFFATSGFHKILNVYKRNCGQVHDSQCKSFGINMYYIIMIILTNCSSKLFDLACNL